MSALGLKLRRIEGGQVAFMCPGCREPHVVGVEAPARVVWGFNWSGDAPTFKPSIKVGGCQIVLDENGKWTGEWVRDAQGNPVPRVCHSFVTDGRIEFLSDCTHALKGQTVDLPDWSAAE